MTIERVFVELNTTKAQAGLVRHVSDEYQANHPSETDHYYELLDELYSSEDPARKAQIVEELSNMDGLNDADMPATWLEHDVQHLKQIISSSLNATDHN